MQAFKLILEEVREEGGMSANRLTTDAGGEFERVKKFMHEMIRQNRIKKRTWKVFFESGICNQKR